ncbi:MAG: hypothetical protein RJB01_592 [Actinomycetota bacterium]
MPNHPINAPEAEPSVERLGLSVAPVRTAGPAFSCGPCNCYCAELEGSTPSVAPGACWGQLSVVCRCME